MGVKTSIRSSLQKYPLLRMEIKKIAVIFISEYNISDLRLAE